MAVDGALLNLANAYGIATEFWDWKGRHVDVSAETVTKVLAALGVDASTPEAMDQALAEHWDKPWRRTLPPVVVTRQGRELEVKAHLLDGHPADVVLRLEQGGTRQVRQLENWTEPREIDGNRIGEASFLIPGDLPLGYHHLELVSDDRTADCTVIVTPQFLGYPASMGEGRIWGYQAQLYSTPSSGSWGMGDLIDLSDLSIWAATQQRAGYVLVNPLHAAQAKAPMDQSPYLPSSRLFVNPMYVRPELVEEYALLSEADRDAIEALRASLKLKLGTDDLIDRDASWTVKREALLVIYKAGRRPGRQMMFDDFRRQQGRRLRDFATWCALCVHNGNDWRGWPVELQRPSSPEVSEFYAANQDEVTFYEWLQWIVQDQLSDTQQAAKDSGMPVGVITDLAVGVSAASADTWMMADTYAKGITVGAPPDGYNQMGQDWGQPPWRPDRLADTAYGPFRSMLQTALGHAGGVRIDHILGMFRLWWIPEGHSAKEGTYVRYDHEAMIGIIALEAQRAGAVVVGEDMGTVEPWVREYLAERGILGTSVLWFEYTDDGHPLPADRWREYCMASVTTHDLPPTAGYLAKDHVKLRDRLGLLTVSLEEEEKAAEEEQRAWLEELRQRGLLHDDTDSEVENTVLALHRFLMQTPSRMLNVALVDAVGDRRTQNQPGTWKEYPNWQVPLSDEDGEPILLDEVFQLERPMKIAAVMNDWSAAPKPWSPPED